MLVVPAAVRLSCWLNAWLSGQQAADDVIAAVTADGPVEFITVEGVALSPALLLGDLRRHPVDRVSAALPVPGDLVGLAGPPEFNADALEAGSAVLLHRAEMGFVPSAGSSSIRWVGAGARSPTHLVDLAEADRDLRACLRSAADSLAELDVAAWQPDVADALLNLRHRSTPTGALPFASARHAAVGESAVRALSIVEVASCDDGGALTVSEAQRRRDALGPLGRAARRALVASCSSVEYAEPRADG